MVNKVCLILETKREEYGKIDHKCSLPTILQPQKNKAQHIRVHIVCMENHDGVIKWKHFPRYWPFVRWIHRPPVDSFTKTSAAELWCFLWSANGRTNNWDADDLRRHCTDYDVTDMENIQARVQCVAKSHRRPKCIERAVMPFVPHKHDRHCLREQTNQDLYFLVSKILVRKCVWHHRKASGGGGLIIHLFIFCMKTRDACEMKGAVPEAGIKVSDN